MDTNYDLSGKDDNLQDLQSMLGSHLAWKLWEALSEQGMIKGLYNITGKNSANNISKTMVLQQKFGSIGTHTILCHLEVQPQSQIGMHAIAAGLEYVERVFSHSVRLKTPTRAALGSTPTSLA
ncbi:hypothetical protein O181_056503 [Austropuccinia psidii MF-1]|uniref:Uncharacterized protein n=1 Tax=Austropuccinia psidii MF-1 TaxID=1389203 RepID=A0A9Q3HTI1_9BASI|nr:hypothetical protein [Austropuccinia psidii MF-1]